MDKGKMRQTKTFLLRRPLIVSYSWSGNARQIAQALQAVTGGDWREIYPWQPYPAAFPELLAQVRREVQTGRYPRLLPGAPSARPYAVVFAGSPNWCGTIAPPLASWLSKNDLSGKIILPFCSHCGGAPCDFRRDIARLCPGADVREALNVIENGGDGLTEALRDWLAGNGLKMPVAGAV